MMKVFYMMCLCYNLCFASLKNMEVTSNCLDCGEADFYCLNGGTCCKYKKRLTCLCTEDFEGTHCEQMAGADASKQRQLQLTLLASIVSLLLTIIVLSVLIFIIVRTIRKSKEHKDELLQNLDELDKEILYVKEELGKLSPEEKNSKLARLSKMIEATARAALITFPALVTPQKHPTPGVLAGMRCNSAPTILFSDDESAENGPEQVSVPSRGFASVRFNKRSIRKLFSSN